MSNIIKFVNLNNGNVYIGDQPYIHWFEGPLSTDLIYTHKLCVLSNQETLDIDIDNSTTFSLLNISTLDDYNGLFNEKTSEVINNVEYIDIDQFQVANIQSQGFHYKDNLYLHILYFSASSNTGGEHLCNFHISTTEETYSYTLGADFYVANENLYINAANFGVEFPDAIQKAIYDVNVREEKRDNITLNRKLKELLSNYWDVIACKGSYKSLINSLKWFEWGDLLELKEIWKKEDFGNILYESRTLNSILEDKYKEYLTNTAKTTYLSLQYALQSVVKGKYDSEKNPILQQVSNKWSIEDIVLKMCLLGNFYKTYFMPIHLDLLHSTITDTVFTNTIKTLQTTSVGREDYYVDCEDFDITINDNEPVLIGNVSVGADSKTLFVTQPKDYNTDIISCVPLKDIKNIEIKNDSIQTENNLKILYTHNYNGPGAIVKISCNIPLKDIDVIKKEYLTIKRPGKESVTLIDNKIYETNNITFYILATNIGDIEGILRFETASGKSFNKKFIVKVFDISNVRLELYRLTYKPRLDKNETYDDRLNYKRFMFERINRAPNNDFYDQYIFTNGGAVAFNNVISTIVFNPENTDDIDKINKLENSIKYYDSSDSKCNWEKFIISYNNKQRNIYIYKTQTSSPVNVKSDMIYNNDLYFLPEKYVLTSIYNKNNTIAPVLSNIICIKPVIDDGVNTTPFNYGQDIESVVWKYKNVSTGEIFEYEQNFISPLIKTPNTSLTKGYYDIIFRYKLASSADIHEVSLKSAFRK